MTSKLSKLEMERTIRKRVCVSLKMVGGQSERKLYFKRPFKSMEKIGKKLEITSEQEL